MTDKRVPWPKDMNNVDHFNPGREGATGYYTGFD